ncbi:hypothetical protein [Rhizobium laguerreae]|uniref:hypothetical protein n=1 Tax=Rhizobium laguerreae TaxID=1076926 RepID=UPI001C914A4E|nr:hypothetical protein [Rhizobium laguerreae]MBY3564152.1 hypothetical protein [Rhizobium laguerreae]
MTFPPNPFDRLPLFATDDEIAIAVVGKARAPAWKRNALRMLDARGFPKVDALHGGRPVPLIRKWYELHMGLDKDFILATLEDGKENPQAWRPKRERRADRKPRLNLDTRCETVLRYMIENPDARTHGDIRGVGELTLEKLKARGVIESSGMADTNRIWSVTDLGREEIKRIDYWYFGKTAP